MLLNVKKKDEVVENLLSPSDCQGNTVWSEVDKTCACNWGWTGNDCDIWGKFDNGVFGISTIYGIELTSSVGALIKSRLGTLK